MSDQSHGQTTTETIALDHDENPLNFSPARRWTCTIIGQYNKTAITVNRVDDFL